MNLVPRVRCTLPDVKFEQLQHGVVFDIHRDQMTRSGRHEVQMPFPVVSVNMLEVELADDVFGKDSEITVFDSAELFEATDEFIRLFVSNVGFEDNKRFQNYTCL